MQQINPALARLWVTPDTLQFGYPDGIRVTDLRAPKERMLQFFEQGFLPSQLEVLKRLANCCDADFLDLMEQVQPLLADWTAGLQAFSEPVLKFLQPEIHRLLRSGQIPGPILEKRRQVSLFISDLGDFGSLLLQNLVAVGFSKFITCDSRVRSATSDGAHARGESRLNAIRRELPQHCNLQLHSLLHGTTIRRVDLAVIIEFETCNPLQLQLWQSHDTPILQIRFSENGPSVGEILSRKSNPTNDSPWRTVDGPYDAEASESFEASRQLAILETQLARAPRRFESAPEMVTAIQQALPKILSFVESNSGHPENCLPSPLDERLQVGL